jgi:hypothetical protein
MMVGGGPQRGRKSAAPKGVLVADPLNKRGKFNAHTKAWRLQHPAPRPNCRAELAGRVVTGKTGFIYPGTAQR